METKKGDRDPRLDFFRGLGLFIILVAHIPWNGWTEWIPARFGFSDAADGFVFCSGVASALAFAPVFDRAGWLAGTARICRRLWQVYWAHVGSFLIVVAIVASADHALGSVHYTNGLRLAPLLSEPGRAIAGLLTLR